MPALTMTVFRLPKFRKRSAPQDLFGSLLHELLIAKTRIHGLRIDVTN